jgi:hypothetical protein
MGKWILVVISALYFAGLGAVLTVPENFTAQAVMEWFKPRLEESIARAHIEDLRNGKYSSVEAAFDPRYATQALPAQLTKVASFFPTTTPLSVKLVGSNVFYLSATTSYRLSYEYEFPHQWLFAEVLMQKINGVLRVEGVRVVPLSTSLERGNGLFFAGKSAVQIVFLIVMIVNAIFICASGFACLAAPITRMKWVWVIFVLFGLVTIRLNWTTGELSEQLISFVFFGAGITKVFYEPAMLQIGLPIGAVIFWMRRNSWLQKARPTATAETFA